MSLSFTAAKLENTQPRTSPATARGFRYTNVEAGHHMSGKGAHAAKDHANDTHNHLAQHFPHVHSDIHVATHQGSIVTGITHSEMEGRYDYINAVQALDEIMRRTGRARSFHDFAGPKGRIAASQPEFNVALSRRFYLDAHHD